MIKEINERERDRRERKKRRKSGGRSNEPMTDAFFFCWIFNINPPKMTLFGRGACLTLCGCPHLPFCLFILICILYFLMTLRHRKDIICKCIFSHFFIICTVKHPKILSYRVGQVVFKNMNNER